LKGGENETCGKRIGIWPAVVGVAKRHRSVAVASPGKARRNGKRMKKLQANGCGNKNNPRPAGDSNREEPIR
jgi:hypothetical protein